MRAPPLGSKSGERSIRLFTQLPPDLHVSRLTVRWGRWGMEAGIGAVNLQRGGPFDDDSKLAELKRQVNLVKDHPAILG